MAPVLNVQPPSLPSGPVSEYSNTCHGSSSESDKEGEYSSDEKGKPFEAFVDENFGGHVDYYEGVLSSSDESSSKEVSNMRRRSQFAQVVS